MISRSIIDTNREMNASEIGAAGIRAKARLKETGHRSGSDVCPPPKSITADTME